MKTTDLARGQIGIVLTLALGLILLARIGMVALSTPSRLASPEVEGRPRLAYEARAPLDTGGFTLVLPKASRWAPSASLKEISEYWKKPGSRINESIDRLLASSEDRSEDERLFLFLDKVALFNYEGEADRAYQELERTRSFLEGKEAASARWLYTVIFYQGVTALRRGENENCIMCRGESSCILPIAPAAVHRNPRGSRLAIKHFTEYLKEFPRDLGVRWLLNLAHMTLGEYPRKVDPRYLVSLERWRKSEFEIGKFRDIGDRAGVNRFNQAGGAVMEDFDNDGLLDLAVTSYDPTQRLSLFRNKGDGTFEDRAEPAGLADQLGGLYCVQADYNNDGRMDLFIPRGAWLHVGVRPSLLRNEGDGTFTDVTAAAGLLDPVNSNSASWSDYDNDGFLDLFICCERQANRLYHNRGDGTFEEVADEAGLALPGQPFCKGAAWLDYDNDRDPDLFLNVLNGPAHLFRNDGDGRFTEVTVSAGIKGPQQGFSCWAWDFDNDGWLDIFATCFDHTVEGVVKGLIGEPHGLSSNKLYRNLNGQGFEDVTRAAGLDMVFATMGSNFGDFDNDGFLDMYLATGDPGLGTLVPNRMFKNVAGKRFAEITASTGTGHLQKGHAVACGDWDRDGDTDLFVEMGGAVNGDMYHDVLFENPGQGNHWLTVKLVGKKTNRAAIGARIKVVTAGEAPLTIQRHVTSGSSFGANTLQQTIGLAGARRVALLEVRWPTSGTTQVFREIDADQAIEVTEFAEDYRKLDWKPLPRPEGAHDAGREP